MVGKRRLGKSRRIQEELMNGRTEKVKRERRKGNRITGTRMGMRWTGKRRNRKGEAQERRQEWEEVGKVEEREWGG